MTTQQQLESELAQLGSMLDKVAADHVLFDTPIRQGIRREAEIMIELAFMGKKDEPLTVLEAMKIHFP